MTQVCTNLSYELCKDATDAPDVDWARVVRRAKQHLGRTVPQRDNLDVTADVDLCVSMQP